MRAPGLSQILIPVVAGLVGTLGARGMLRSVGESLVPLLDRRAAASGLSSLLGLVPAALLLAGARFLWLKSPRDRRAKALAAGGALLVVLVSYVASGDVTTRGDFHGLLTPEPGTSFVETSSSRPKVRYAINAHGFRAPEFAIPKPPGMFRVAIAGGSFVFGAGLEQDQTLSAALAARLRERAPGRAIEALNLGIAGDGIGSHVEVVELAHGILDADAIVLGLVLPAELSPIDAQNERRGPFEVDAFHVASWALGMQAARYLWSGGGEGGSLSPAAVERIRVLIDDLKIVRDTLGERPMFVFGYEELPEAVRGAFGSLPGVMVLPTLPHRPEDHLPDDGHPSAAGNRALAEQIAGVIKVPP
ncbi:MAG: hypothetical protein U0359_23245 [Byssovorax sp.]